MEETMEKKELTPEQKEWALYEKAVQKFGIRSQLLVAVEEMTELQKALLKFLRYNGNPGMQIYYLGQIMEEMADVEIMMNQLELIFGDNNDYMIGKLAHLEELVGGEA